MTFSTTICKGKPITNTSSFLQFIDVRFTSELRSNNNNYTKVDLIVDVGEHAESGSEVRVAVSMYKVV
jgi:hypothetical protein